MSRQFLLPGIEALPQATDRLFFALLPTKSVLSRIEVLVDALRLQHGLHSRPIELAQLHVSLFTLGNYCGLPQRLVSAARYLASQIVHMPFTVRFDKVMTFNSKSLITGAHPTVLLTGDRAEALQGLRRQLVLRFRGVGFKNIPTVFTPHMTLLYDMQSIVEHAVEGIEWEVREFVLVQRHINQRRPFSVLGTWSLHEKTTLTRL